jgi:hypothetical protein
MVLDESDKANLAPWPSARENRPAKNVTVDRQCVVTQRQEVSNASVLNARNSSLPQQYLCVGVHLSLREKQASRLYLVGP